MYAAIDLSKYIVSKCIRDGHPISILQLQKILYCIQKAFLKKRNCFSGWYWSLAFGPVIPDVYYHYCGYGVMPVSISRTSAYTLETILTEKYKTILRRNVGTTRFRDFYELHTLFRSKKDEIRLDMLKAAVLHTVKKRDSVKDIEDWQEILADIKAEPLMQSLWDNYVTEN